MEPADNIRLNELMFKALDHAVWSVEDGELLVPFVMTETTLGYLTRDGVKNDAIFVQAFDKNEENGILLAQRYRHKTSQRQPFEKSGNPALVAYLDNPIFSP